jgi:hypothetical protein
MTKIQTAEFISIEDSKLVAYFGNDDHETLVVIETALQLKSVIGEHTMLSSSVDFAAEYTGDIRVLALVSMINRGL